MRQAEPNTVPSFVDGPPRCPICARDDASSWLTHVGRYEIWTCAACLTDFVFPRPSHAELSDYYDRAQYFEGGERGGYDSYDRQTEWSIDLFDRLLDELGDRSGASVLDIGCAYGSHLDRAYRRGWKCYGVEVSAHARRVARERHGNRIHLFESIEHVLPRAFDLIVMADVLEHFADPIQEAFLTLFAKGAIVPATRVVVTTPNAASRPALSSPADWAYRHPPSHLLFFSPRSLETLFARLRFTEVRVEGFHPITLPAGTPSGVEEGGVHAAFRDFEGLLCRATGSDFAAFMRERHVPGTWSKVAEYEHLPVYRLAAELVAGKDVLDFACGSGYGAAILAETARSVTGVDIETSAIAWAEREYRAPSLRFSRRDDLGAGLPAASFDVITCFEMLERVAAAIRIATIEQFVRLLRPGGIALISSPNPPTAALDGASPDHVRERTREELLALLASNFRHLHTMTVSMHPSVVIAAEDAQSSSVVKLALHDAPERHEPAIFLALCSQQPLPTIDDRIYLDASTDVVHEESAAARRCNALQMRTCAVEEEAAALADRRTLLVQELHATQRQLHDRDEALRAIHATRWHQLGVALSAWKTGARAWMRAAYLLASLSARAPWKRLRALLRPASGSAPAENRPFTPYLVRLPRPLPDRPRVLHVIANFITGGSTQLVVDLIERLGDRYEQHVVTRYKPSPECYVGAPVTEIRMDEAAAHMGAFMRVFAPDLIHVHFWRDYDEAWYLEAFKPAEALGVPIIENVNVPVEPHRSRSISRYVFVSDFAKQTFGAGLEDRSVRIYPGSDLDTFRADPAVPQARDVLGMVYRLERDKLDERAIEVFIEAMRLRPATRALIVGGGSLLQGFQRAVERAGLAGSFEFTGYVGYDELPALYARMTVFVAPVWSESFGQVSSFAMSMGVPVVGYAVGALPEIVAEPALCAPPGTVGALARIAVDLLDDDAARGRINDRNRERVQAAFSVQTMIAAYHALYGELVRRTA